MKFARLRPLVGRDHTALYNFVTRELTRFANDVFTGLSRLSLVDNFQSIRYDVELDSGATQVVPNRLATSAIDIMFINNSQPFGLTVVNSENITVKNLGSATGVATVLILKR